MRKTIPRSVSKWLLLLAGTAGIATAQNGTLASTPLPNTTLTSGTVSQTADQNITALNRYSISGSAVVAFRACNQIILGPGFTAVAGSGGVGLRR